MIFCRRKFVAFGRTLGGCITTRACRSVAIAAILSISVVGPTPADAQEAFLEVAPRQDPPPPPPPGSTGSLSTGSSVATPSRINPRPAARRMTQRNTSTRQISRPASVSTAITPAKWNEQEARAKTEIFIKEQEAKTASLNAEVARLNERLQVQTDVQKKMDDAVADRARTNWVLSAIFGAIIIFMLVSALLFHRLSRALATKVQPDRPLGPNEDPTTRDIPLTRLPLGLPDGSVRAIISLFIVIVGFLVLAFQKTLEVESAAAISGFIGAIISFYFATRNEAATRDNAAAANQAASQANTALQEASKDAIKAAAQSNQLQNDTLSAQLNRVLTGMNSNENANPVDQQGRLSLQTLSTDLEHIRQLTSVVAAIPVGTGPVGGATEVVQRIDTMLASVKPLLSGTADPATVATVAAQADALLREITADNPIVSTITGALATVTKAAADSGVVGQVLTGLGGPIGLVGGLLFSGIKLFADQRQFEAWKKAVLAQPFDIDALSLSPDDPTLPEAAASLSPLVTLISQSPDMIRELYRISIVGPGQTPKTSDELATESASANTLLFQAFGRDARVLTDAINEYRTTLVSLVAANALPPQLPGDAASAMPTISSTDLVRAVGTVRQEPAAAGALDQLISVVEALAKNALGIDLAPLLSSAMSVAKDLLQSEPEDAQP